MIDRQSCYSALFTLKNAGIDISDQLMIMQKTRGVPRGVLEFLRENSPQFQFYRYIQKHQKALAESLLDYELLSDTEKLITCSSFVTRAMIAVKYKNLDESLLEDLNISEVSEALHEALLTRNMTKVNDVLKKHSESLRVFYKNSSKKGDPQDG